jgi:hypothetical protein
VCAGSLEGAQGGLPAPAECGILSCFEFSTVPLQMTHDFAYFGMLQFYFKIFDPNTPKVT